MLAIWEYFWNTADWTPNPPTPTPTAATGSGGGHRKTYSQANQDYWDARQAHLEAQRPRVQEPVKESVPETVQAAQDYTSILSSQHKQINDLSLQIEELNSQYDEEAMLALLL